jgi:hypothetical protein
MGAVDTPPRQRPRTVEGLQAELSSARAAINGKKPELQALLAEANAQAQTMVRGTVRFKQGYRA